ncbi:putative nuclease HARBI1 [Rhagoletis pomonella]|uniref:putative nuclease HARBI1 n=1 Tax=Rhagoletis pomonella TaxID=28610 RepID=UPI0017816F90|nr:putative nuclease HARBI1 [Rhagoletis pomonella]
MQAICDERKKFLNVFIGFPGSSHDSWVLQNSPVFRNLSLLCGDYYILGDSAYPCSDYIITPFKDNGHLTRDQKYFNIQLSKGRVVVENSFGILKQRFRQLYYCKLRGMKKLCHFIGACCVLHNIANENDLEFMDEHINNESIGEVPSNEPNTSNRVRNQILFEMRSNRR